MYNRRYHLTRKVNSERQRKTERDFSVLVQGLPPNAHLMRQSICDYLSAKFGNLRFVSFAFDDRILFDAKPKYPRKTQVFTDSVDETSIKSESDKNGLIVTTLIPMILVISYIFAMIPTFASGSPPVKFLVRIFGHSFIKAQSDMRQRDAFATRTFSQTVKSMSYDMFAMECVWSVAGRFLLTGSAGSVGWYYATLVCTAYIEFFMRVNAEALEGVWLKYVVGKPLLTGQALANYRIAEAASQAQDDAVEQGAILLTGGVQYFLFNQRAAVSLGFGGVAPTLGYVMKIAGSQLIVEVLTDIVTTSQLIDGGLNVHVYYDDVEEDGVITPHTFMHKVNESCCFLLSLFAMLMFFRIAPIPFFCSGPDICKCVIYKEETERMCTLLGGGVEGGVT